VPTLIEAAELLVNWTDPKAIGAGIIAITLIGTIAVLLNQQRDQAAQSASAGASASAGTGGAQATQPTPSTPEQLKQRAQSSENPLAQGDGETVAEMLESEAIDDIELLSRFVLDSEGDQVGETMTVTEDEVVLKQEDGFLAVDPDAVIEKDGNLLLDPNVDWEEAEQRGESWRESNLDRMEYDDEGLPEA